MSDDAWDELEPIGAPNVPPDPPPPPPVSPDGDDPPARRAAGFALNDIGNGQRFTLYFGPDAVWVPRVGWFRWTGQVWRKDPDMIQIRGLAQQVSARIEQEVRFLQLSPAKADLVAQRDALLARLAVLNGLDKDAVTAGIRAERAEIDDRLGRITEAVKGLSEQAGQRLSFAKTSGNTARIDNMISEAGIGLARPVEAMDAAALEINTLSGVLRFSVWRDPSSGASAVANVALVAHDRAQMNTKIMPVSYDRFATAPQFDAFLQRIMPSVENRLFLQRWFGLSMTALTGEQKLCFFYGDGANGKSVLVDLMARLLGDYAATAKIESLTGSNRRAGGDATPDLVPLIGARFVRASEPDQGVKWQEGLIKELTGGEEILIRALHSDFVAVRPQFKLTLSGNNKPDIRGTDDGIWRRVLVVPFEVQIPAAERIPKNELDAMLFAEAPGVLNWLIEGLLSYLEGGLREPVAILAATTELREENDPYGTFLEEACVITGDARDSISAAELVYAFHYWMASKAEGQFKDRTVAIALKSHSRRWRSRNTGLKFTARKSSNWYYDGIRFTDTFQRRWRDTAKDTQGRAIISNPGHSS